MGTERLDPDVRELCDVCPLWAAWIGADGGVWCDTHRDGRRAAGDDERVVWIEARLFPWQEDQR